MNKIIAAVSIVMLSGVAAMAAEDKMKSSADAPAASGMDPAKNDKMAPGTTGAMQAPSNGVATTPEEVQKQGGMGVGADGQSGKAGKEMGGSGGEKPK